LENSLPVRLKNISIRNFKSIKSCDITDCKRINLFIGKPNVGKSNILEALSLFSIPFLAESKTHALNNLIRVETETELFYQGKFDNHSYIETDGCVARINYHKLSGLDILIDMPGILQNYKFDEYLNLRTIRKEDGKSFIRKYTFSSNTKFKKAMPSI